MKKLAAGNWKMNGTQADLKEIAALAENHPSPACDILICPPAPLLIPAVDTAGPIAIGAQDCHTNTSGAHTGEISAAQIRDTGARYVILGHSERRTDHEEKNALIAEKITAAWQADLIAILCIGETLAQYEAGQTLPTLYEQLDNSLPNGVTSKNTVIAYEPVWAIGSGKTPTVQEISDVHDALRTHLLTLVGPQSNGIPLLYGGSVKPQNAAEIFAIQNVDGALVGGASLKANDFSQIITALEKS